MASLSFIIGLIGNIISLLVFASPIRTFRKVVKKKSTENYKAIPYITTLLSTSLWTFYGLLKPGGLLIVTVNAAGAVLQFVYVTLFLIYAPKDIKVKSMKLVGILDVFFLGTVIGVTLGAIHGSLRLTIVGIICAVLTIGMYAAPLSSMRSVVKTKSVEYMPFSLSFFLFLNGGVWSVYSLLVKDYYVGVPNAIGFVLGSAQLILYTIYKNKSPSTKSEVEREEEGSTNLIKNAIEMQGNDEDDPKSINRSLRKGSSLPKSSDSQRDLKRGWGGIILRDNRGHLVDGRRFKISSTSAFLAEAFVLRETCLFAKALNLSSVCIENDNVQLISLSVSEFVPSWEALTIIYDILLLPSDLRLSFCWTPWEGNEVAHWIASFQASSLGLNWVVSPPCSFVFYFM